jgi:acetylornithine deacetylase/succinyl-diaminopimelate desuccinylase-like protein
MTASLQRIDSFLESNLDRYLADLSRLCAQPSVSARREGTAECAVLVAQLLEKYGLRARIIPTDGDPVIVGQITGQSARTLLCYNHYDVQPPEPLDQWQSPPFEPTIRDGRFYARGARDDKGEIVARLAALDAARRANDGQLPCGVTFVVEGEEEIASPHIAPFVRDHIDLLKCDGALWEEGGLNDQEQPTMGLGCRGILYVELAVETLARDAHSGAASLLPNAAWRLLRALATIKDDHERVVIPGFYERTLPPTALDEQLMDAMPDPEPAARAAYAVKHFVRGLTGRALNRAVFSPTANLAGLASGFQGEGLKTVIPARASAKLDFRLVPDQDPEEIFGKLRAHLDAQGFADVQLTRLGQMWPYKAAGDHPLIKLTVEAAEMVYRKNYQLVPMFGGSSPIYAFARPLGNIPVISAGVGFGLNSRAHAPNENIRLIDFLNAARHIARIMDGFAEVPWGADV